MTSGSGPASVLNVAAERHGSWWVLRLTGELDVATAPRLAEHIAHAAWADPPPRIALDLSGLSFCNSSGLNVFVRAWKRANAVGGELVLLAPPPRVAASLRITALDRHIAIAPAITDLPD